MAYQPTPSLRDPDQSVAESFTETVGPCLTTVVQAFALYVQDKIDEVYYAWQYPRRTWQSAKARLFTSTTLLILGWFAVLYWGEVGAFNSAPAEAQPHHLVFIADPQLVDPHTYPGRPWPLSSLTYTYTDLYMRRSYSRIQDDLDPHSVVFLGDLFDGGREWATDYTKSPDAQLHQYGQAFWRHEFTRFSKIFFTDHESEEASVRKDGSLKEGQNVIASLPGNHDLGFGAGVLIPVRQRFQAYFGVGNRVDVLGNHTFVGLDTLSLSAKGSPAGQEQVFAAASDFLKGINESRTEAEDRYLNHIYPQTTPKPQLMPQELLDLATNLVIKSPPPTAQQKRLEDGKHFPTVLLTHVPLYRQRGTPCGPLRERHPPQTTPAVFPDDGNAIPIRAGYQYQNALSPAITFDILSSFGDALDWVFSGDDHDYCDVQHEGPSMDNSPSPNLRDGLGVGRVVREITTKSISWAMGVRKPAFLLVSLWNPISSSGLSIDQSTTKPETLQTHLCHLPDQLGIFLIYAATLAITLFCTAIISIYPPATSKSAYRPRPHRTPSLSLPFFSIPAASQPTKSAYPLTSSPSTTPTDPFASKLTDNNNNLTAEPETESTSTYHPNSSRRRRANTGSSLPAPPSSSPFRLPFLPSSAGRARKFSDPSGWTATKKSKQTGRPRGFFGRWMDSVSAVAKWAGAWYLVLVWYA